MRAHVILCLMILTGCTAEATPGFTSGLAAERAVASLDAAEVDAFCRARFAWMGTVAAPGWESDVVCLPPAMLHAGDPASCEAERASCASSQPPFDAAATCAEAAPKPSCDPSFTVGELEDCWEAEITRFTTYSCDVAGTADVDALIDGASPRCRALFADPDCNFFAP